jgi:arsenate reductase (thioredoxin)
MNDCFLVELIQWRSWARDLRVLRQATRFVCANLCRPRRREAKIVPIKMVLFACVQNAGRSQMAAAWFNRLADPQKARAISAGTKPARCVHAVVVDAMHEVGIDLSSVKPQLLTPERVAKAVLLITMGCGDECPYVPELQREDWPLPDPAAAPVEVVRDIRDRIEVRVRELISRYGWQN